MSKNDLIKVICFGQEIGLLGFDEEKNVSYFQYNPEYLQSGNMQNIFPAGMGIIRRIPQKQVFSRYNSESFRGLPPMIADSLPDMFGNIIFREWLERTHDGFNKISILEQLAYVANRGMGALEFRPSKDIPKGSTIVLDEVVEVLKKVLDGKEQASSDKLDHQSLLTIFKIGSSAGGARPKVLISQHKKSGRIIPGDINVSGDYNHLLVKLNLDDDPYDRETVEYCYYLAATHAGVTMMPSHLIDGKHFATTRFDRIDGKKKHVLTTTGMTGWDFAAATPNSTYENLFELALFLKLTHAEITELFRRMVFNIVFCNTDSHFKNQSFIYDEAKDTWSLSPAYDITYSLNPTVTITRHLHWLSVNGKRTNITYDDIMAIAEKYTIKNSRRIVLDIQDTIGFWKEQAAALNIPGKIRENIAKDFVKLI